MRNNKETCNKGFTLIELLVVIAIIGVLSTVALTSVNSARIKARNAKKIAVMSEINKALYIFYSTYNRMPNNYHLGYAACEGDGSYEQSMGELVSAGLLEQIPQSPDSKKYCYYNYGANGAAGALMVTTLLNTSPSTTGLRGSCRPFSNTNWCSTAVSTSYYCICAPY